MTEDLGGGREGEREGRINVRMGIKSLHTNQPVTRLQNTPVHSTYHCPVACQHVALHLLACFLHPLAVRLVARPHIHTLLRVDDPQGESSAAVVESLKEAGGAQGLEREEGRRMQGG